jgi:hypothetical protein
MKNLTGSVILMFSLFLFSFKTYNIDDVATAIRSGNVDQLSLYLDNRVDISLPDKTDTYGKIQAEMIIRDFFTLNVVRNFQVKQKGQNAGMFYCIGMLQTHHGNFRTSLFMKQKGDRQYLQELRFQPVQ